MITAFHHNLYNMYIVVLGDSISGIIYIGELVAFTTEIAIALLL